MATTNSSSSEAPPLPTSCTIKAKCTPCESLDPSHLLTNIQIQSLLESSPVHNIFSYIPSNDTTTITTNDNSHNNTNNESYPKLSWKFTAKNFISAMNALNAMSIIAEREGHHPDFHLTGYRHVEIVIYTHSVGGVTKNDLLLAEMLFKECGGDIQFSPKFLREHPQLQFD